MWRPSTDRPAIDSVPWTRRSADVRRAAVRVWLATAVLAAAFWWLWAVGASWLTVVLLGVATVAGLLLSLLPVVLTRGARADNRLLESRPWRMATAEVFARDDPDDAGPLGGEARLLVDGAMWLSWAPASWAQQQVVARTGQIWIVGPDSDGRALFCSAGLAVSNLTAEVIGGTGEPGPAVVPEQLAPVRLPNAGDDLVARSAVLDRLRIIRRLSRYTLAVAAVPVLAMLALVLGADPLPADELIGVGLLAAVLIAGPLSGVRTRMLLRRSERLLEAGPWTAVPVAVGPEIRFEDRPATVRMRAILADGHATSVRVRSTYQFMANVRQTGQLWVAGEPSSGRVMAAGLPGYPFVSLAHIGS